MPHRFLSISVLVPVTTRDVMKLFPLNYPDVTNLVWARDTQFMD